MGSSWGEEFVVTWPGINFSVWGNLCVSICLTYKLVLTNGLIVNRSGKRSLLNALNIYIYIQYPYISLFTQTQTYTHTLIYIVLFSKALYSVD